MEESNKNELVVKCVDNCSCLSIDKWSDETDYYVTFYKSYQTMTFWYRVKDAIKILLGKDVVGTEVVLTENDFNKIKNFK
jgi:hypothetical protein